jgi:hypothetical protein
MGENSLLGAGVLSGDVQSWLKTESPHFLCPYSIRKHKWQGAVFVFLLSCLEISLFCNFSLMSLRNAKLKNNSSSTRFWALFYREHSSG